MTKGFSGREARRLTGKEKAILIFKHFLANESGDKQEGFLSESDIMEMITSIKGHTDSKEYNEISNLFLLIPLFISGVTEAYIRFKYYYECLRKAQLLIILSPAIDDLTFLIDKNIKSKTDKEQALRIVDEVQSIHIDNNGEMTYSDSVQNIKKLIPLIHKQACEFISMKPVFDKIIEKVGSNFPWLNSIYDSYQIFIDEIKECIDNHNNIIFDIVKERSRKLINLSILEGEEDTQLLPNIKEYIIPKPTYNSKVNIFWQKILFEGNSGNDTVEEPKED